MGTFADLGLEYSAVTALAALAFSGLAVAAVIGIILYVLKAGAVCDMSAKLGLKNPWYSFVPIFSAFAFGRLAQRGKRKTLATVLTVLEVLMYILAAAVAVFTVFGWIELIFAADKALAAGKELSAADFSVISKITVPSVFLSLVMFVKRILKIVCSYKIFNCFDNRHALVFTLLLIFFPFLSPFFLFAVRKNEPKSQRRNEDVGISGFNFGEL